MDYGHAASQLREWLELDRVPVGVTFVDGPVDGIATVDQEVPSACAFWRLAESRCFYAPAEAHFNCPIGAATMGFDLPDDIVERLGETVQLMTGAAYLHSDEIAHLPRIKRRAAGIVYGPLSEIPVTADAVLVWMTPRSAMIFAEAQGDGRWDAAATTRLLGRPGCAAIPETVQTGSAMSLGCMGMRTFTQIADSHLLGVVAATRLDTLLVDLQRVSQANSTMLDVYKQRAATFP